MDELNRAGLIPTHPGPGDSMTIEAEVHLRGWHTTLRGPPAEIAQILLALHQNGIVEVSPGEPDPSASERVPSPGTPTGGPGVRPFDVKALLARLRSIPTKKVQSWVKEHPKGNALDFAREFLESELGYSGPTHSLYISTYNKLARARRKVGLPAPSKSEE
jgi:hypothetical protein